MTTLNKSRDLYAGKQQLVIATGFNFAPAWNASQGSLIRTGTDQGQIGGGDGFDFNVLTASNSDIVSNWAKTLGDGDYKDKLRLLRFGHRLISGVIDRPINTSYYTVQKIDDAPLEDTYRGASTQRGRYMGSYVDSSWNFGSGFIDKWFQYTPIADNVLIAYAVNHSNDAFSGSEIPQVFTLPIHNFGGRYRTDTTNDNRVEVPWCDLEWVIGFAGDQVNGRTASLMRVGFMLDRNAGWRGYMNVPLQFDTRNDSVGSWMTYQMRKPEAGLYVPVYEHGSGYKTTFTGGGTTLTSSGLAYGLREPNDSAVSRITAGDFYPDFVGTGGVTDKLNIPSSEFVDTNEKTRMPSHGYGKAFYRVSADATRSGAGGGATIDFTATGGLIDDDVVVEPFTQLVEGAIYRIPFASEGTGANEDYTAWGGPDAANATEGLVWKATNGLPATLNGDNLPALAGGQRLIKKGIVFVDTGLGFEDLANGNGTDSVAIRGNAELLRVTAITGFGVKNTMTVGAKYRVTSDGAGGDYSSLVGPNAGDDNPDSSNTGIPTAYAEGDTFIAQAGTLDGTVGYGSGAAVEGSLEYPVDSVPAGFQPNPSGIPLKVIQEHYALPPTTSSQGRFGFIIDTVQFNKVASGGIGPNVDDNNSGSRLTQPIGFLDYFAGDHPNNKTPLLGTDVTITPRGAGFDYSSLGGPVAGLNEGTVFTVTSSVDLSTIDPNAEVYQYQARAGGRNAIAVAYKGPRVGVKTVAGLLEDVYISDVDYDFGTGTNGDRYEDGDVFTIDGVSDLTLGAETAVFVIKKFHQNISMDATDPLFPALTAGNGMQIDYRVDNAGRIIEYETSFGGSGLDYKNGDAVRAIGGLGGAEIVVSKSLTGIPVEYVEAADGSPVGAGMNMLVDVFVDNGIESLYPNRDNFGWKDGSSLGISGVELIRINDAGNGLYKSGDILKIKAGNEDCLFKICYIPENGDKGNDSLRQPNLVWEKMWGRHSRPEWTGTDDQNELYHKFRVSNSERNVVDFFSKGLPINHRLIINGVDETGNFTTADGTPARGSDVTECRLLANYGQRKYCDLNIWEFDNDAAVGGPIIADPIIPVANALYEIVTDGDYSALSGDPAAAGPVGNAGGLIRINKPPVALVAGQSLRLAGFDQTFDSDGWRADRDGEINTSIKDDLNPHARVMPLFGKSTPQNSNPNKQTIEQWELGIPNDWSNPVTGSTGGASIFNALTDGKDTTFARAGFEEQGYKITPDKIYTAGDKAPFDALMQVTEAGAGLDYSNITAGATSVNSNDIIRVDQTDDVATGGALLPNGSKPLTGTQELRQIRTFESIASDSGYACDEIVGIYFGASRVIDPDGEDMEIIIRKGKSTSEGGLGAEGAGVPDEKLGTAQVAKQSQKLPASDFGAVGGFWGQGNLDFETMGWVKGDNDTEDDNLRVALRRKLP
jgi:hypothetical protein